MAQYFQEASEDERAHAQKLIQYQVRLSAAHTVGHLCIPSGRRACLVSVAIHTTHGNEAHLAPDTGREAYWCTSSVQNIRGGRVRLHTLVVPEAEFEHAAKGEALYSMELALSLEKLNFHKLNYLHGVASHTEDPEAENFVENMLEEQVCRVTKLKVVSLAGKYLYVTGNAGTKHA